MVGFALIWQMWLLAGLAFVAMMAAIIVHTFNYKRDYYIPADEVVRTEDRAHPSAGKPCLRSYCIRGALSADAERALLRDASTIRKTARCWASGST